MIRSALSPTHLGISLLKPFLIINSLPPTINRYLSAFCRSQLAKSIGDSKIALPASLAVSTSSNDGNKLFTSAPTIEIPSFWSEPLGLGFILEPGNLIGKPLLMLSRTKEASSLSDRAGKIEKPDLLFFNISTRFLSLALTCFSDSIVRLPETPKHLISPLL